MDSRGMFAPHVPLKSLLCLASMPHGTAMLPASGVMQFQFVLPCFNLL
jgi:hypothetical protein